MDSNHLTIDSSALTIANDVAKSAANRLPGQISLMTERDRLRKLIGEARVAIDQNQPISDLTRTLAGLK